VYVPEHNSKPSTHDELDEIRRQLRQKVDEVAALLQRFVQALDNNRQLDHDDFAPIVAALSAINQIPEAPKRSPIPTLQKHDMEAFRLAEYGEMKQTEIARQINAKHHTAYSQGHISRMVNRVRRHMEATGFQPAPKCAASVIYADPAAIDENPATDRRCADSPRSEWRSDDE